MARKRIWLAGAVALLAAAGAVLAWQLGDSGHPTSAASGGQPKVTTTVPSTTVPSTAGGTASQLPGPTGAGSVALGIYVKPAAAVGNQESAVGQFESSINRRLAVVQTFAGWETASGSFVPFPKTFAAYAESIGATPMITWQPEQAVTASQAPGGLLADQPNFSLAVLSSGRYDGYIRTWATEAKAFGRVVYVRLMHEMNDPTYPWSIGVNGNTSPQEYITAWRHIVGIFQQEGANNVHFVWCVGAKPASPNVAMFFPGDAWASWVAIDGYNRGTPWESFTSIFSEAYAEVTAVSTLPLMIAETGSVEEPGNPSAKADWITSAFEQEIPQQFPRVRAVLYFDAPGRGFSYALNSSPQALTAFTQVAASSLYQAPAPD